MRTVRRGELTGYCKRNELTNRETMSICMLFDNPHAMMPMAANKIADWFAPLLPITLLKRPYNGVNVHVASKYLSEWGERKKKMRVVAGGCTISDKCYIRCSNPTCFVGFIEVGRNRR